MKNNWKKVLFLISVLVLLTACGGNKSDADPAKQGVTESYTAERILSEDFNFRVRASWKEGTSLYIIGSSRVDHEHELLRYDLETGELKKTILEMGNLLLGYASQAYVDNEGSLHALCYFLNDEETAIAGYRFCVFDAKGKLVSEKDYTESIQPFMTVSRLTANVVVFPDDKVLFSCQDEKLNSLLIILSETGSVLSKVKIDDSDVFDLQLCEDGRILVISQDTKKQKIMISEMDRETGELKAIIEGLPYTSRYEFATGREAEKIYYVTKEGVWECEGEGKAPRMIFSCEDVSLNGAIDIESAIQMDDDTWRLFAVMHREEGEYNYFDYNFLNVKKSEGNVEPKIELTLAVIGETVFYQNDIFSYNKSQDEVKVVLRAYENADLFVTDVIAGNIPDLVDLSDSEVYSALEKKDLLEDLCGYLSMDGDLSKTDFLEKSLQFYEKDGKVYAVPYGLMISAMMGNEEYLGDREAWDFEEFREFIDTLPNPEMATKVLSKQQMLWYLCLQYLGHFVDEARGECDFKTKEFYALLECANLFSDQEMRMESVGGVFEEIRTGEIALVPIEMNDVESYELWRTLFSNQGRVIGFPAEEGQGICLLPTSNALAILSTGDHKDLAWDFLKFQMKQKKSGFSIFPSYQPFFEEMINEARKEADSKEPSMQFEIGGMTLDVPHASLAEIEMLQELIKIGSIASGGDGAILRIISEGASAFFDGDKSVEQAAELIQNRVKLYLVE